MRLRILMLLASVAFFAAAVASAGALPRDPWIVFTGSAPNGTQPNQIFRVRLSGMGLQQITTGRRPAMDPSISPNGKRIAFARAGFGVFTAAIDGAGLRRLTTLANDRWPVWSPDGRSVAFARAASGYSLFVIDVNGRKVRRLAGRNGIGRPEWMPDGRAIVIPSGGQFLQVDARSGKIERRLRPTYDTTLDEPSWSLSPDGRTIAIVGRRSEPPNCQGLACEVYGLDLYRVWSAQRKRALDGGVAGWSPDSRTLVYLGAGGALYVQAAIGGTIRKIDVGNVALDGETPPVWQPR